MRALLFLCLVACARQQGPFSPVHPDDNKEPTDCVAAEQNLLRLECKDSEGGLLGGKNRAGVPFHTVCEEYLANSVGIQPLCLSKLTTCDQLSTCD